MRLVLLPLLFILCRHSVLLLIINNVLSNLSQVTIPSTVGTGSHPPTLLAILAGWEATMPGSGCAPGLRLVLIILV